MKKTEEDSRFAARFAEALQPHIDRARAGGKPLKLVASELGVTAWGLRKQLDGGTPSIRTIARAYALYGVSVPYEGIKVTKALSRTRRRKLSAERQLLLPLQITAPASVNNITLKRLPRGSQKYEFGLSVTVAS